MINIILIQYLNKKVRKTKSYKWNLIIFHLTKNFPRNLKIKKKMMKKVYKL